MSVYYVKNQFKQAPVKEGHVKRKEGPQVSSRVWVARHTYMCIHDRMRVYLRDRDRRKKGTMRDKKKTICLIFSFLCEGVLDESHEQVMIVGLALSLLSLQCTASSFVLWIRPC